MRLYRTCRISLTVISLKNFDNVKRIVVTAELIKAATVNDYLID